MGVEVFLQSGMPLYFYATECNKKYFFGKRKIVSFLYILKDNFVLELNTHTLKFRSFVILLSIHLVSDYGAPCWDDHALEKVHFGP